ncbi:protein of unknown function DUF20 [Oceanospirillum multiglobuliferum]|uniref:AI-2E family transporter n=1 Tax=Oceanospirillum multiglobuliferum TaxID=64969 RepID=A0A1T4Q9I6_9GAMM|nr:AI-2E family transporter [Oceanospirillum multiglobuliferum]OPX56571.1 hypothetical protein BTE48_03885 [Oceanospirillum multiglobuliferum]SKA00191.1 protein of unknown function DUF20 [Oceanospirillum multiglobuliferum]
MNFAYDALSRAKRRQRFYVVTGLLGFSLFIVLIWTLRELTLPAIVGALAAYLCHPLLALMRRWRIPKGLAILTLFAGFFFLISLASSQIRDAIPDEQGKLELRVRIQYKLDDKYQALMQIDEQGKGNLLHRLVGAEIEPFYDRLNRLLMLNPEERASFERYYVDHYSVQRFDQTFYRYFLHNLAQYQKRGGDLTMDEGEPNTGSQAKAAVSEINASTNLNTEQKSLLGVIGGVISLWMAAPFVFLFLLLDEGEIKRSVVQLVPNHYFEMVLTVLNNVDDALGKYLRGTFLECTLVGFTLMLGLYLIGLGAKWAFVIGTIAGLANAIPFLGPAIGLLIGAGYALIVETFTPFFSIIDADNMVLWVCIVVAVTQLLDNAVYQPIVLGNAVSLHPLVVIIGVMGGSILLGFIGMLFAVPVIVIVKVVIETLFKEMKAYQII